MTQQQHQIAALRRDMRNFVPELMEPQWKTLPDDEPPPVPHPPPVNTGGYPIDEEAYWASEANHLQSLSGEDCQDR